MSRRGRDTGEGPVSYLVVFLLIASVTGALAISGVGVDVAGRLEAGICKVSGTNCGPESEAAFGKRPADPSQSPSGPTEDERAGKDAAEQIRDYFGNDCAWYKPWTWGCDEPTAPMDVIKDMSPGEIKALFDELGDDEIRRLLKDDGVVEFLKLHADAPLLHELERIAPKTIEPDYTDTGNPGAGWGLVPNGQLWGSSGEPSLTDINQGGNGDCWWLASVGSLTMSPEGRERLRNMIHQNPNGTYTVTFGDGEKVTVTPYFPLNKDGNLAYAQASSSPPVIWPLVLEKALAEKRGSYGAIEGDDPADGMELLTGKDGFSEDPDDVTREDLQGWLKDGNGVIVSTKDEVDGKDIYKNRLHADHAYVVRGVTSDGRVRLYNPWGYDHATLTMEEFNRYLADVDINPVK